tara:strand:+ start:3806 stop:4999 length:1194 start_codon:yes stop_codon:yes gene_type:complete
MADSNKTKLSYAPEVTFNVDPTASATWAEIRMKSESFKADLSVASSDEIRSYRDIPALNLTDRAVSGGIDCNLSYDSHEDFLASALGASTTWSSQTSLATTGGGAITTDGATKKYTHASGWANNPAVGQWVYLAGFAQSASNGWKKVATVPTPNTIFTVEEAIGTTETLATGSVLPSFNLSQIVNADALNSWIFQRQYTDLTDKCARYSGCVVNGFSIDASANDTIGVNFDIVGALEVSSATVYAVDGGSEANNNTEMTSQDHVQEIRENGVAYSSTSFSLSVSNNLRSQYKLGTLGADAMKLGDLEVSGTVQAYFTDSTAFDKFLNQTQTSLSLIVSDETTGRGNAYIIDLPAVKFTDGTRVAGGRNQDIIADLSFTAFRDSTEGITIRIAKTASA